MPIEHVLLTGSTGMVGRNLLEHPGMKLKVTCPSRKDLDLQDSRSVVNF